MDESIREFFEEELDGEAINAIAFTASGYRKRRLNKSGIDPLPPLNTPIHINAASQFLDLPVDILDDIFIWTPTRILFNADNDGVDYPSSVPRHPDDMFSWKERQKL